MQAFIDYGVIQAFIDQERLYMRGMKLEGNTYKEKRYDYILKGFNTLYMLPTRPYIL
jgi:hypothetical protein